DEPMVELDLFYQSLQTYKELEQVATVTNVQVEEPVFLREADSRLAHNDALFHLEKHFDERPGPEFNLKKADLPVQVAEAVHPRAEVEGVIQEILRLVREENYRFRDMAIFVRETEAYHDLLTTLFADYEIPVFIDEKRTMLNHPFIEFLRSLFDVVES